MAKELKNQKNWIDLELPDLRSLDSEHRLVCPGEVAAATSQEEAYAMLVKAFGCEQHEIIERESKIGPLIIERDKLAHIIEKRQDARERYLNYALATLDEPYEVWKVAYDDETCRYAFIGTFQTKRQMLVVVNIQKDNILWNFMHTEAKRLNKHRHGELVYRRFG